MTNATSSHCNCWRLWRARRRKGNEVLRQRATDRPVESSRFSASSISGCNVSSGAQPDSVADSQPPGKSGKYVRDAGNATGVDAISKHVIVDANDKARLKISYDYLILATGANYSYFGHDEFAAFAPGAEEPCRRRGFAEPYSRSL